MAAYAKAIVAGLIAGLSILVTETTKGEALTTADFLSAALAALVALSAVWAVPNKQEA